MAFPPPKRPAPGPGGPPLGMPPMGGPGMPPGGLGMPPMGGLGMPPPGPGMPPGLGAGPPGGDPSGMPVGASMPGPDDDMSESPLLAALAASMGGGPMADPLGGGGGQGDPQMGIEGLLQLLGLGEAGVGGGAMAGMSGVPMDQPNIGGAMGLGY